MNVNILTKYQKEEKRRMGQYNALWAISPNECLVFLIVRLVRIYQIRIACSFSLFSRIHPFIYKEYQSTRTKNFYILKKFYNWFRKVFRKHWGYSTSIQSILWRFFFLLSTMTLPGSPNVRKLVKTSEIHIQPLKYN